MRMRMVCCSLLLMLLALFPLAARVSAQEDGFVQCGTLYPGWWHHLVDPKGLLTINVQSIVLTRVDKEAGQVTYEVTFALTNKSQVDSPVAKLGLTHVALATNGGKGFGLYWDPDRYYDPNNPINRFAVVAKSAQGILLPAVQRGKAASAEGSVCVPFTSNVQLLTGNVVR